MLEPLGRLCNLGALMTRIHDGRLNGALAITLVHLIVLTPGFPHRLALLSLQGFLQGRSIQCTTNRLYLCLLLDMTMHSFIHLVALVLRVVASASSDDFYDFYAVYSDSVLDSYVGYSTFYVQLIRKILLPVHFECQLEWISSSYPDLYPLYLRFLGNPIPYVYFIMFNVTSFDAFPVSVFSWRVGRVVCQGNSAACAWSSPILRIFPQIPSPHCTIAQDVFSFNNHTHHRLHLVSGSSNCK
jgi:hypothetical protein